jgi:precorrin-3B methylase
VVALFNPKSRRRDWQLDRAREILLDQRPGSIPVGIVRHATRPGENIVLTTLADLDTAKVDMFSIVIVGNSTSRFVGNFIMTPRGYEIDVETGEAS